jgi:hypothetical protein
VDCCYTCHADLAVNARDVRRHPTAQAAALKGLPAEVGIADALLAYPSAHGGTTCVSRPAPLYNALSRPGLAICYTAIVRCSPRILRVHLGLT